MTVNKETLQPDPKNPYIPPYTGTYISEYLVGGKKRRMVTYIPEGTKASTAGVYLFLPDHVKAEEFMETSRWMEIADTEEHREKLVLFVLEAAGGSQWRLDEPYSETPQGELEYIWLAFETSMERDRVCVYEGKRYFVGYREGAVIAQKFAMWNPADFAGIVCADPLPMDPAYLSAAAYAPCARLHNYVDETHSQNMRKGQIPMRAWYISGQDMRDAPEVQYWRKANQDDPLPIQLEMDTIAYPRTRELPIPADGEKEAYQVWITRTDGASENCGALWNRSIWKKFLYPYIRWAANPGGSYRKAQDPVYDLGMEYHYQCVDGWMREWYVHVPSSITESSAPVPLVFVPHGYSCTGELCTGNANWHKVADQYGFIAVFPTALYGKIKSSASEAGVSPDNCPLPAWNVYDEPDRPSELNFFLHMLEDIKSRYPVNPSRIYVTGTSMGNLMAQYLALKRPDIFAAAAPTSGILHMAGGEQILELEEVKKRPPMDIPIWMFGGEMESWLLDAVPAPGNRTWKTLCAWWGLNRMPGEMPEDFTGKSVKTKGRYNDWTFEKEGIPMLKFTGIDGYPHGVNPEMSYRIWEEFFSKIQRDEKGNIIYESESLSDIL